METSKLVVFTSRNKDNKGLEGFKQRSHELFVSETTTYVEEEWNSFVNNGVEGELSRMYVSYNDIDTVKTNVAMTHYLIDHPDTPIHKITDKFAAAAMQTDNLATKRWLLDLDEVDYDEVDEFLLSNTDLEPSEIEVYETYSGYAIVVAHGFDTRKLLETFPTIENKKANGLLFRQAQKKEG